MIDVQDSANLLVNHLFSSNAIIIHFTVWREGLPELLSTSV